MTIQTPLPAEHSNLWAFFDEYCGRLSRSASRYLADLDALEVARMDHLAEATAALCVAACRLEVRSDLATNGRKRTLSEALLLEVTRIEASAKWSPAREVPGISHLANLLRAFAESLLPSEEKSRRGRPSGGFGSAAGAMLQSVEDAFSATGNVAGLGDVLEKGKAPDIGEGCDGRRSEGVAALMNALAPELQAAGIPEADIAKAIRNARAKLKKSSSTNF